MKISAGWCQRVQLVVSQAADQHGRPPRIDDDYHHPNWAASPTANQPSPALGHGGDDRYDCGFCCSLLLLLLLSLLLPSQHIPSHHIPLTTSLTSRPDMRTPSQFNSDAVRLAACFNGAPHQRCVRYCSGQHGHGVSQVGAASSPEWRAATPRPR